MTTDKPTGAEITEAAKELGIDLDDADMDIYHATALENFGVYAEIDAEDDDPGLAFRDGNRDWAEPTENPLGAWYVKPTSRRAPRGRWPARRSC